MSACSASAAVAHEKEGAQLKGIGRRFRFGVNTRALWRAHWGVVCWTGKAVRACVVLFGGVRLVCQSRQVLFHIVDCWNSS